MNGVKHNPSETGTTSSVLRKHPFTTLAQSRNQFINVVTLASVHNATLNHGVKRNTNTCMLIVRFVFHTRTNFSLHNADSSIVLYVNNVLRVNCIFASTHQLQLSFKEIRNPVNTDNRHVCLMPASFVATGWQAIWALHWLIFLEYYFRLPSVCIWKRSIAP